MCKFNHEGYYDPTAYEALKKVTKPSFKPLAYICSPYSGDIERNVEMARVYSRFALENNAIPLAPHLLFPQFMDDAIKEERELAMFMNMVLLGKCNQLWVFGDIISPGMAQEIEKAKKRNQIIRYFTSQLQEVDLDEYS